MGDMEEGAGSRAGDEAASAASGSEDAPAETMVLSRARRANAGNRMSSLIALAEADDQERVIYGDASWDETADDLEFGGADAVAPDDVSLVSSSDGDEDDDEDDDEAGEKELKKQERLEKSKKRKELANPFANRKKAKLATTPATPTFAPQPRPKKKSERDSWIPIQDEGPTRASSRRQTMKNKEDTHARLLQKEKTREKVVRLMEAANKRKEQLKANPLSQAEKMAMAAKIEKENSKSLNRWEEAENRRAEEQQAHLDALRNRKLEGPFIRYWSAQAIWKDDKLVTTGKKAKLISEVEETLPIQPPPVLDPTASTEAPAPKPDDSAAPPAILPQLPAPLVENAQSPATNPPENEKSPSIHVKDDTAPATPQGDTVMADTKASDSHDEPAHVPQLPENPPLDPPQHPASSQTSESAPQTTSVQAPAVPYPASIMFAPPPSASGFLDGILDWASYQEQPEPVPAPPPQPGISPVPPAPTANMGNFPVEHTMVPPATTQLPPAPPPPKPKPVIRRAARNLITLSHFDELTPAQKDKIFKVFLQPAAKPSRYLTSRAQKHNIPPQILCAITAQPARYRDPATGLPYRDKYAYKCIQRLVGGSCQWSSLLQCYVGPAYGNLGGRPAAGVPERFYKNISKAPKPAATESPAVTDTAPDAAADAISATGPSEAPVKTEGTVNG